jgi:hypothetical protein
MHEEFPLNTQFTLLVTETASPVSVCNRSTFIINVSAQATSLCTMRSPRLSQGGVGYGLSEGGV